MNEEWKEIEGKNDTYLISNTGRFIRKERAGARGHVCPQHELRPWINTNGYVRVSLTLSDSKTKQYYVHRLVAQMFLPVVDGKDFVNHKDGNKKNNCAENLEWCTRSENEQHAWKMGLHPSPDVKGDKHPSHKLTSDDVIYIRQNHKRNGGQITTGEFARKYNVDPQTITEAVAGRTWRHIKVFQ